MATIQDYSKAYEAAKAKGDKAGMDAAHAAADAIRGYGTTTKVVNGKYEQVRTTPEVIPEAPEKIKPVVIKDNSQAAKQAYIESQLSQLKMNYNTNKAGIDNSYNRNLSNAGIQKDLVYDQYGDIQEQIGQENFNNMRYNKQMGVQRGITSSAQMLGADVATQRAGNNQMFAAEKDKNLAINGIQTFISQLGEAYGVDQQTLESNYGTAKLKAMSDGELMALESQLKVDMFNAGNLNQFSLSDKTYGQNVALNNTNNQFTASQNTLNQKFTAEQNQMDRELSAKLSSISNSNQSAMFKQQMAYTALDEYMGNIINGYEADGSLTATQLATLKNSAYSSLTSGDPTAFKNYVSQINIGMGYKPE